MLRPRLGFLIGERRGGVRRYRTSAGVLVYVRHRTRDVDLINEIIGHLHAYEPPRELARDLDGPLKVLDLGGNIGIFGAFALSRWTVVEMHSFEPDPGNAQILTRTVAANAAEAVWMVVPAAVSNRSGTLPFLAGRLAESRQAIGGEPGVPVDVVDLFSVDHDVDLCKIDIEASEWAILTDPRLAVFGARILVIEWHRLLSPDEEPERAVRQLLEAAGYEVLAARPDRADAFTGVVWARRPSR